VWILLPCFDAGRTQLLCRCIELSRDQGYTKYLALAQLREGLDAIKVYEKAVEILIRDASLSVAGTEVRCAPCLARP